MAVDVLLAEVITARKKKEFLISCRWLLIESPRHPARIARWYLKANSSLGGVHDLERTFAAGPALRWFPACIVRLTMQAIWAASAAARALCPQADLHMRCAKLAEEELNESLERLSKKAEAVEYCKENGGITAARSISVSPAVSGIVIGIDAERFDLV